MQTSLTFQEAIKLAIDDFKATPELWTTQEYARNAKGKRCSPRGKTATCWCMVGRAMYHMDICYFDPDPNDNASLQMGLTLDKITVANDFSATVTEAIANAERLIETHPYANTTATI